ncbi:LOW QUALITY PROTEIN: RCC1-like G exchanging factor-like protein [Rhagoletis pomonella]|uniref:LOW QUALITY PROTEIN: RCC1-like G exchanging factor-like protein n=1 Tax=Rhagoletis pomonella TaxID=28610 RepID=UPI0017817270|nr:LOW QUALITY PROTEIN: RCC1-like G exchanging factor-like protein [Rhagoletis pomonella]
MKMWRNFYKIHVTQIRRYTAKAKRIALMQDKSKILMSDPNKRRVYAWGFQETGALGLQSNVKKAKQRYTEMVHHPSRMQFSVNTDITDIAAGYGFSAFAVQRSDGQTLFGTGLNTDSQLGFQFKGGSGEPKNLDVLIYPTAINLHRRLEHETNADLQVRCMSAGRAHLIVVTQNGTVFSMGNNSYGQCGRPIIENEDYHKSALIYRIPEKEICGADDEIVSVECGQDHTMFLTRMGCVYSCGWSADGQTGKGNYDSNFEIEPAKGDIAGERIVKLSCASDCVLALNDKGEIFGWGNSEYGQLDNSESAECQINKPRLLTLTKRIGKVIDIAAGGSFCMALNEDGLVYTWGNGILGFGPYVEQTSKPQHLQPLLFGRNAFREKSRVISIGCGVFHMGAINSDVDLFMWGKNRFGHLGLGHKKYQFFPFKTAVNGQVIKVVFGVDHSLALCRPYM